MFRAETWVLIPKIERALDSLMHGAARRLTGRQPRIGWDGKWYYPSLAGAMKEAGFTEIRKSITNRQNMVAQYISTRLILDLCERNKQRGGERVYRRCWDQKGIDWEIAKERAAETDSESEAEMESDAEIEVQAEPEEKEEERSKSSGVSGSSGAEWSGASVDPWE